ncbi:hypothetical protein BC827DRAFT_1158696 [Russula dissimulans]|nr:hypothetical protein BC827DRAFT_1158696 [Russula dissimulans]
MLQLCQDQLQLTCGREQAGVRVCHAGRWADPPKSCTKHTECAEVCVMVTWSLLLLSSLLPLMKRTYSQTGGRAGRHTRWRAVTGSREKQREGRGPHGQMGGQSRYRWAVEVVTGSAKAESSSSLEDLRETPPMTRTTDKCVGGVLGLL